ncbi:hypothetical protein B9479_005897 [Cryptococcus floricola]|uniref:Uncharacterized protein n=1 Tax=Cryptococcus floricola TaxID=2591691 RepID=A0A5D3ATF5_9TREE|nr:hypothetical protein B9479_005897 [Cryptococcus floricola]
MPDTPSSHGHDTRASRRAATSATATPSVYKAEAINLSVETVDDAITRISNTPSFIKNQIITRGKDDGQGYGR